MRRNTQGRRDTSLRGVCSLCGHGVRLPLTVWFEARQRDAWPACKEKIVCEAPVPSHGEEKTTKDAPTDSRSPGAVLLPESKTCSGWIYPIRRRCETCGATLRNGNFGSQCAPCTRTHGRLNDDSAPQVGDEATLAATLEVL